MPQQAHVLTCVEFDAQTLTCTVQAWMPAPSLLPDISTADVLALLSAAAVPLAVAWGAKLLGRTTRD